jgi:hypothetical protein
VPAGTVVPVSLAQGTAAALLAASASAQGTAAALLAAADLDQGHSGTASTCAVPAQGPAPAPLAAAACLAQDQGAAVLEAPSCLPSASIRIRASTSTHTACSSCTGPRAASCGHSCGWRCAGQWSKSCPARPHPVSQHTRPWTVCGSLLLRCMAPCPTAQSAQPLFGATGLLRRASSCCRDSNLVVFLS